jgi:RES domain-containing protein
LIVWRVTKTRYDPFDGSGAERWGGRWNQAGRPIVYAADSFAGAILEILVHASRPRTLPGPHHAARFNIPDELIEWLDPSNLPGWAESGSPAAEDFGTRWLDEKRSAVLAVPSLPSRPIGKVVLINPRHADAARVTRSEVFPVEWDERLF